ncbi:MAG TPA: RNA-directed DNA polymerase [Bryobacteraceae bacterium]|nr:RNA-directed DNA polymerase [Bryobacteraceae bacterium]
MIADLSLPHCRAAGQRSFLNWLKYDQYRKFMIFKRVHPFLVVTDVSNFFDSVLHSHVAEALHGLPIPTRTVGLLFFLLERLSIRQEYAGSHGISLPVDEFDCSRTLAHMVLFPHDDEMVNLVKEENYVRWMDDQNMAVPSKAAGLKVLAKVGRSLSRLHLSPNAQKSKVLSLSEARRHFHLDFNKLLDEADGIAKQVRAGSASKRALRKKVSEIWKKARIHEGDGEFAKVLKRLYRIAGLAGARQLRRRATRDVLTDPSLADRICDYMRCTGTVDEYLSFAMTIMWDAEQVYPDVNVAIVKRLLRLEPSRADGTRIRRLAVSLLSKDIDIPGAEHCAVVAPLLLLRFGDRRSLPLLKRMIEGVDRLASADVVRACAIVYASFGADCFRAVRKSASTLLRNHLSQTVRFVEEIQRYPTVPDRYKARLYVANDPVAGRKFVDMRIMLMARLLLVGNSKKVTDWVANWKKKVLSECASEFDKRMVKRLL